MNIDSGKQYTQNELPGDVFNAGNGDIKNFNGQAVKVSVNNNGTRNLSSLGSWDQYQAGQTYQQYQQSAISTLKSQGGSLSDQYGTLLSDILGQGTVAMNSVTLGENNNLAARGITNNSGIYGQQMSQAQLPVQVANQAATGSLGFTEAQLQNQIAEQIAGIQSGAGGTLATLPLNYGSLQLAQAANVANIGQAGGQEKLALTGAEFVSTPYGLYNTKTNQYVTGAGTLPSGGQVVQKNGQYFLNVP